MLQSGESSPAAVLVTRLSAACAWRSGGAKLLDAEQEKLLLLADSQKGNGYER